MKKDDRKTDGLKKMLASPSGPAILILLSAAAVTVTAVTVYQLVNGGSCLMLSIFGIPCPACGLTRAALCALSGRLKSAFAYHPLFFVPYIMIGLGVCSLPMKKYRKQLLAAVIILALAMLLCWAVRLALGWRGYEPI